LSRVPTHLLRSPIALLPDSHIHEEVTTSSPLAQRYYDQGLLLLYTYDWINAARSFSEALRRDPHMAMAHLGLSFAYTGLGQIGAAHRELNTADTLRRYAGKHDLERIYLRRLQLAAMDEDDEPSAETQYIAALNAAVADEPSSVHLLLLRGNESEGTAWGRGQAGAAASKTFYDQVLRLDPHNLAAHHFLTHTYERSGDFSNALVHARAVVEQAPFLAHPHHMYGHELLRLGKTKSAIAEFETADHLSLEFGGSTIYDWHRRHNLNLLAAAYAQIGQLSKAEDTLTTLAALPMIFPGDILYRMQLEIFLLIHGQYPVPTKGSSVRSICNDPLGEAFEGAILGNALAESGHAREAGAALRRAQRQLANVATDWKPYLAPWIEVLQAQIELLSNRKTIAERTLLNTIHNISNPVGTDAWVTESQQLVYIVRISARAHLQQAEQSAGAALSTADSHDRHRTSELGSAEQTQVEQNQLHCH